MVEDKEKLIKEQFQKEIDNKIKDQMEVFKVEAKKLNDAKDKFLRLYSRLKQSEKELKDFKGIGKEENLDITAYIYKIERDIDEQKEKLEVSKRVAESYKKVLGDLVKKHKEEIKAIKKRMFEALEEERARKKREKEIIGD